MAVFLKNSGNSRVAFKPTPRVTASGQTECTYALTLFSTAGPVGGRIISQADQTVPANFGPLIKVVNISGSYYLAWELIFAAGGQLRSRTTNLTLSAGNLYRIVCRYKKNVNTVADMSAFVNGVNEPLTDNSSVGTMDTIASSTHDFALGYDQPKNIQGEEGFYSEVVVWNRQISDDEAVKVSSGHCPRLFRPGLMLYSSLTDARTCRDEFEARRPIPTVEQGWTALHPAMRTNVRPRPAAFWGALASAAVSIAKAVFGYTGRAAATNARDSVGVASGPFPWTGRGLAVNAKEVLQAATAAFAFTGRAVTAVITSLQSVLVSAASFITSGRLITLLGADDAGFTWLPRMRVRDRVCQLTDTPKD